MAVASQNITERSVSVVPCERVPACVLELNEMFEYNFIIRVMSNEWYLVDRFGAMLLPHVRYMIGVTAILKEA